MVGRPTERSGFPGGLRAQMLGGLLVLVVVAFGLVAAVSLHVVGRQLQRTLVDNTQHRAELAGARLADAAPPTSGRQQPRPDNLGWSGIIGPDGSAFGDNSPPAELVQSLRASWPTPPAEPRTVDIDGSAYLVAVAGIDDSKRLAVATHSMAPIRRRMAETRQLLAVYLGLDALFLLVIGYAFFTYLIARPIRAIGVATQRAARGDLASPIDVLPANEFGRVGRQFNQMLDELRHTRDQLEAQLDQLNQANDQLRRTQESLVRSEKLASVGQLAAGIAHEVGNPLAAISGYLDVLGDQDLDAQTTRDIIDRSKRQVDRIHGIIRHLLDYSRQDAGARAEPVAVADCIDEALHLVRAQPKANGVELDYQPRADIPLVDADASQIVQVLVNLLINAVDACNDQGDGAGQVAIRIRHAGPSDSASDELISTDTISTDTISTDTIPTEPVSIDSASVHQVIVAIADNGPGISAEEHQRIFDPFFTTKDPGEGTGLGLAICLRIMKRYGGDIRLKETEETGATFHLIFPLTSAAGN